MQVIELYVEVRGPPNSMAGILSFIQPNGIRKFSKKGHRVSVHDACHL